MLTITFKHTYSEYNFEIKLYDDIYPYSQILEQPEEEFIEFNRERQMEPNKLS